MCGKSPGYVWTGHFFCLSCHWPGCCRPPSSPAFTSFCHLPGLQPHVDSPTFLGLSQEKNARSWGSEQGTAELFPLTVVNPHTAASVQWFGCSAHCSAARCIFISRSTDDLRHCSATFSSLKYGRRSYPRAPESQRALGQQDSPISQATRKLPECSGSGACLLVRRSGWKDVWCFQSPGGEEE